MQKNLFLNSSTITNTLFSELLKMHLEHYNFKASKKNKNSLEMDENILCIVIPINNIQIIVKMIDSYKDKIEFDIFGRMYYEKLLQNKLYIARIYIQNNTITYFETKSAISVVNLKNHVDIELNNYISNFNDICSLCNKAVITYFNNSHPCQVDPEFSEIYVL